ncbi:MAG: hypothetical protein ABFD15_06065 [Methanofastidiosum sp.]
MDKPTQIYRLTVNIHNPCHINNGGLENIDLWTYSTPEEQNIPKYIIEHGFRYVIDKDKEVYRIIPPYQVVSIHWYDKPIPLPEAEHRPMFRYV